MAIALPGLDKVPEGPLRDFVSAVHAIYDAAGQPAARVIAKATVDLPTHEFQSVSHETVSATLRAGTVPAWEKIRSMLHVMTAMAPFEYDLTALEQDMIALWRLARHVLQDTPQAPVIPVQPQPNLTPPPPAAPQVDVTLLAGVRPPAAPGFVGRGALIEWMGDALAGGTDVRLVLYGPVGTGKTQAVLQYLERHADADHPVWWVPSTTVEAARASLVELAAVLGVEAHHRVERTVRLLLDRLETQGFPYLMVFDGLDGQDLLRMVPNGGHVIITTCDPVIGRDVSSVGVEVADLDHAEAEELLRRHEPGVVPERIQGVLDTYGRTPLALRQTVAWWQAARTPFDVSDGVNPADRLTIVAADGYGRSASRALLFALDRLEAASRPALRLLETLSCFAPVPVSKHLLGRGMGAKVDPALAEALRGEVALTKAIAELCRHGLARLADDGRRVEVMPLARLVAFRALSGEEAGRARGHAHALLAAADPGWPDEQAESAELYWEIAAHVEAAGLVSARTSEAREVVYHQIRFRYLHGDHAAACHLGERAYLTWRAGNDPAQDDHLVLRTSQEWANALRAAGRYEKAGELTRAAMSQLRVDPLYGEQHRYTLAMAASRAADLRISGDYRQAREFDEETLERCEAGFGDDHPRTTMSRHNLAVSLRLNGDFAAAEQLDRSALRQHRDTFGDGNWRTLLSVNALAEDLNGQGRYQDVLDEVEPMVSRVEPPPRTRMYRGLLLARRALALARRGTGRLVEALDLLELSHAECAELFGERHEYTLAVRMSHANTLHMLGRTDEAANEATLAHASYRELFGGRNPLTVAAEINLANMLRARGEHARAMRIDVASSESLKDKVRREHPFSVAAAVNLASDYARIGHPERLAASRRAFDLAKRVHHQPDHPARIAAEANLTIDSAAVSGPAASGMRQQVLLRLGGLYGPDHPIAVTVARGDRIDCVLEPPLP
ncbi:FxSxx-COOH system tetratricopeptide repeat protein [Dactylosporangium sp. NPDC005555]|uniref:FxSxx-COOH system tetratricopeptide repeat protein n=1 Tax=Dactylosporangium sp. NPDC005555 TaxID=3154889 RepID=UPI0033A315DF